MKISITINVSTRDDLERVIKALPDDIEYGVVLGKSARPDPIVIPSNATIDDLETVVAALAAQGQTKERNKTGIEMHTRLDRMAQDPNLSDSDKERLVAMIDTLLSVVFNIPDSVGANEP